MRGGQAGPPEAAWSEDKGHGKTGPRDGHTSSTPSNVKGAAGPQSVMGLTTEPHTARGKRNINTSVMTSEQTRDIFRVISGQKILSDHFTWLQVEPARSTQHSLELLSNLSAFYNMQSRAQCRNLNTIVSWQHRIYFWEHFPGVIFQIYGCFVFYLLKWTCEGLNL